MKFDTRPRARNQTGTWGDNDALSKRSTRRKRILSRRKKSEKRKAFIHQAELVH
jgi:hypothetical protein